MWRKGNGLGLYMDKTVCDFSDTTSYPVVVRASPHCSGHSKVTNFHKNFINNQHISCCQISVNKLHSFKVLHALGE